MTDQKLPADWAIEWALKEVNFHCSVDMVKKLPDTHRAIIALARRIEQMEQPPVSIELRAAREAVANDFPHSKSSILAGEFDSEGSIKSRLAAIERYKELRDAS